jgi:hypothetical protein
MNTIIITVKFKNIWISIFGIDNWIAFLGQMFMHLLHPSQSNFHAGIPPEILIVPAGHDLSHMPHELHLLSAI